MLQPTLFALPSSYAITVRLELNGTWSVVVARNHVGEPWDERMRSTYSDLSLSESIDVIAGELLAG